MKSYPAAGTEGMLLIYPDMSTAVPTGEISPHGHKMVECKDIIIAFRIYENDENGKHKKDESGHLIFRDYRIRHHDLKIKLLDGQFYETEEGDFLDYAGMRYKNYERKASDSDKT